MRYFTITLVFLFIVFSSYVFSQEKKYKIGCFAFYNVENLFDTINNPLVNDIEFTPQGSKLWNSEKYFYKISKVAEVISKLGVELTNEPPAVIGLCEVENDTVLKDLVKDKLIQDINYQIVHHSGPDKRGIDCALIYNPELFEVKKSMSYRLSSIEDFITRDQLVVNGIFDDEEMTFIVVHYPSRRGGEKRSRPNRAAAADLTRHIVDSILNVDQNAKIIVMGDFNDDPNSPSVEVNLNAKGDKNKLKDRDLFNPMKDLHDKGIGSLAYRDQWNLFDQIILSNAFVNAKDDSYKFYKAFVFNKPFLMQKDGRYKGYPFRTFVGDTFKGGYSDHFPAYIFIIKEII
jgi:hypothetical protein